MTTTQKHPELDTTNDAERFRECEGWMRAAMRDQIGIGNLMAISGLRIVAGKYGVELPVAHGYRVQVLLQGNDTYTVRTLFVRGYRGLRPARRAPGRSIASGWPRWPGWLPASSRTTRTSGLTRPELIG